MAVWLIPDKDWVVTFVVKEMVVVLVSRVLLLLENFGSCYFSVVLSRSNISLLVTQAGWIV